MVFMIAFFNLFTVYSCDIHDISPLIGRAYNFSIDQHILKLRPRCELPSALWVGFNKSVAYWNHTEVYPFFLKQYSKRLWAQPYSESEVRSGKIVTVYFFFPLLSCFFFFVGNGFL